MPAWLFPLRFADRRVPRPAPSFSRWCPQRTMLELLNQLDGFESSTSIKVLMECLHAHTASALCLGRSSQSRRSDHVP